MSISRFVVSRMGRTYSHKIILCPRARACILYIEVQFYLIIQY